MSKSRQKEFLDTATRRVVADYTQNEPANLMERIHRVNRACPGQSKQNVAYLLKNNEYDVEETIRRIKEEGATELIGEWSKNTSKKKKKKKKDEPAPPQKEIPPSAPRQLNNFDARPSSNSNSSKPAQLSNSTSPKPSSAPVPPTHPYTSSLPIDGYPNTYQQLHPVQDNLLPNHNLLSVTTSLPTNNIQFLLLQLQTHSSYLSQWQGMLQQRMDTSLQILRYVFEQLQASLSERHQLLQQSIETGKFRAEEIFEQRKKLAQRLTAQAKSAPSEAVAEQIKQFLADKQNDQQLCDVYTLNIDHESMMAAVPTLGDIVNSIPQYWADPAGAQVPQQQQAPYKPPNKHAQPAYQTPEFHPPPVQTHAPPPPVPPVYAEPEVPDPLPEPQPAPEVSSMASQVYEVTLTDPYSSDAKPVDLTSSPRHKSSRQEIEAARERMQGMLDKQKRGMIVSDAGMKGPPVQPAGKRGGERKGGREAAGGKGKPAGRNATGDKRGPPPRREGRGSQSEQWTGSRDNGPTFTAEYTNSSLELEGDQEDHWDNSPNFVPSLVLVNNNYDNTPDETAAYQSIASVASAEFKPTVQDSSPDEPTLPPPPLNSFMPTTLPSEPQPQPEPIESHSDPPPETESSKPDWDDPTVTSTDWAVDHDADW